MRQFNLRRRLIIILAVAVSFPLISSGYIIIHRSEQALITEKESKLFGIARALDVNLNGDYNSLLSIEERGYTRDQKIRLLNAKLAGITDNIVSANPGVGAGYYCKDLDGIITYGPSCEYSPTIGQPIGQDHLGREVMSTGVPKAVRGQMVRGNILNAMVPIVRNNEVIGYVWANELTESIDLQIKKIEYGMYLALAIALLLGLGISMPMANRVSNSIQCITGGLKSLLADLNNRLPEPQDEFGEIAHAINEMAQSLINTRSHTELIIDSMVDGIITIDNEGRITAFNKAAERIMGLGKDIINVNYMDLFPGHAKYHSLLLETLHTGRNFIAYEKDFIRPDGDFVPLSISTSMLYNGQNILGAIIVFRDLTEHKAFEDQIRRMDRLAAVGELAAGVAHEIRNPLAAISGSVQILVDEVPEENPSRVFGDVVLKEIQRLNSVIEDLLCFAKPSKNFISNVNPNELAEEVLALLSPCLKKELIVLEKHFDPKIGLISVDRGLIKQVLVNILLNAIQALHSEGGNIKVITQRTKGYAEITIEDNGTGVTPVNKPKIFDPFFTTKDGGIGLGLATSNKIVEIHYGYIHVESTVGLGSTFTIGLPYKNK